MKRLSEMVRVAAASLAAAVIATAGFAAGDARADEAPSSIKIGYALSLTGPFAPGATTTIQPGYLLWAKDINEAGGIYLKKYDKKVPVEMVEYDDGSNVENAVRHYERMILNDKVDLVMPPWGTGINMAVAPVLNRHGMPHIANAFVSNEQDRLVQRWPNIIFLLTYSDAYAGAVVDLMKQAREKGDINNKVAVTNVADQFGVELARAGVAKLQEAGFEVVYNKSYPPTVKDLSNLLKEIQQTGADSYISFSYPGDTILITNQSVTLGFAPKVFLTAVGTAFPFYKAQFKEKAEGVLGFGGWDRSVPGADAWFKRHVEVLGKEPDRWGSPVTYASLQMLHQAIEAVGEIDRPKILEALKTMEFDTIIGKIQVTDKHQRPNQFLIGQWQDGEFVGVAPANLPGAKPMKLKSGW